MVQAHPITPTQRAQSASTMIAHAGQYGIVTALSQALGVSRPTLYAWKATARQALEQAFLDTTDATVRTPALERQILTYLLKDPG